MTDDDWVTDIFNDLETYATQNGMHSIAADIAILRRLSEQEIESIRKTESRLKSALQLPPNLS